MPETYAFFVSKRDIATGDHPVEIKRPGFYFYGNHRQYVSPNVQRLRVIRDKAVTP